MSRSLPERPSLDFLKHEAKRILRSLGSGDNTELALIQLNQKHSGKSLGEIQPVVTLVEVQHALALDYGFGGWPELKKHIESTTPVILPFRPVLPINSWEECRAHYADWLGFNLDWEWREASGQPVIAAFSRDEIEFMVNETPGTLGPVELHLDVRNLNALEAEWNSRRSGSVKIYTAPPYEFPEIRIKDPFGNVFCFEGKDQKELQQRLDRVRPKMRRYVQEQIDAGRELPTPEEIRDVVGPPLGLAIEVLNEFPGYEETFNARR